MKLLDIKNLSFEYFRRDDGGEVTEIVEVLKDISLEVEPGQFVAIVGRNGSGKSTLAKHMNAILLPGSGEVIVDGMDVKEEELRLSIRQTAGMVFQNPDNQFVANMVEEDVAFGPENLGVSAGDIKNRVNKALALTDMELFRQKALHHLSGGQKQRVAVAGVLAMEPKCIILDEADAMLDPEGRKKLLEVAKYLQHEKQITIIMITHHMEAVFAADRVFVMKDGCLEAQGTPGEIFAQPDMLEDCGLRVPPFQEYLHFLTGQGIVTRQEAAGVEKPESLVLLLLEKCGRHQADSREGTKYGMYGADLQESFQASQEKKGGRRKLSREGLIFDHVTYTYQKGLVNETDALKNVSLHIGKGEFVAVIGHTGCGKSTLLQHMNGLLLPSEGSVYYDGQDIADGDYQRKNLRQKVGLVFQYPEYQLFAETVEKDVCFGPENMEIPKVEAQKRAYEAIAAVGLPDTIYDTSPLLLSGGQKRRVAIAGVLAMQPEFLVLDEPTAGLDPYSAKMLLDLLKGLQEKKGITVVMVTHSMEEAAEYAERIVVMEQGEVCMDAAVWEVFSQREELQRLGLDVPVGVKIMQGLKKELPDMDLTVCKREDICKELLKMKEYCQEN